MREKENNRKKREKKKKQSNIAEHQTPEPRPVHDIHYLTPNNTLLWVHTRVSLHSRMYTHGTFHSRLWYTFFQC